MPVGENAAAQSVPDIGLFGALGWCLVLLFAQFSMGCFSGALLGLSGLLQLFTDAHNQLMMISLLIGDLVMLLLAWQQLAPGSARKLNLCRINELHLLVVLLLVLPLSLICEGVSQFAGSHWDAMFGEPGPGHMMSLEDSLHLSIVAYTGFLDGIYETIAAQPWPVMLLIGCLLPGICEEVFFRGFLGQGLIRRHGVIFGVLTTSLIFGLFHMDPVQACYTFVAGIVLHCVYLWTRTLWAPVLLHILFNSVGFTLMRLQGQGTLFFGGPNEQLWLPPSLVAVGVFALLALLTLLYQSRIRLAPDAQPSSIGAADPGTTTRPAGPRVRIRQQQNPRMWAVSTALVSCLVFGVLLGRAASVWFDPNSALAHLNRGHEDVSDEDYQGAANAFSRAIRANPRLSDSYIARAEAYRMLGEFDRALQDLNQAIQLAPRSALCFANRGEIHRLLGDLDAAAADCNRAINLDRRLGWAWCVRGRVHSDKGDWRPAIDDFEKAIRLDPQEPWTFHLLSLEIANCPDEQMNDTQEAIRHARTACELSEWSDTHFLATLAAIYAADGQFDEAIRVQRDALQIASNVERPVLRDQLAAFEQGRSWGGPYVEQSPATAP